MSSCIHKRVERVLNYPNYIARHAQAEKLRAVIARLNPTAVIIYHYNRADLKLGVFIFMGSKGRCVCAPAFGPLF